MATTKKDKASELFIKSRSAQGFRRCGHSFTPNGHGIALDQLTAEQIKTLKNEPQLIVEEREIDAEAE